ncbi:hypothetical protein NE619_12195 [Anaerovorax odorimutans]|uniref:Uncharacterized protein n=1 Tax=Anaerovorax odorimutans TaxID=109327 RepID=A0ABT1RQM0_9FIRM|nr:hypothetical protein [Anaerovorax odorimutans]MCQ4637488.1 hypothetical protein [Anaerovorax odorimutans]
MKAIDFFHKFRNLMQEDNTYKDGRKYKEIYKKDAPEFTKLVNKQIVPAIIGSESNVGCSQEYYRIDVTSWINRKDEFKNSR